MTKPGNSLNSYAVDYLRSVVKEDIPTLPKSIKAQIKKAIETRLTVDPIGLGKPLRYSFKNHRRIRVGDYPIVYRIDHELFLVTIVIIKHRKDVYED
ncbi:MAG: type II toxin-antitoxin system RelE/ParE family toxin [Bdellovibrionales bacterium]|nr:type II toxin-antitoxin system RelE/ParE family toxin [Oligoflexia bacterium]